MANEDRDAGVPEAVRAAWEAAVGAWDDKTRHDAFIGQVATFSCYAWAAARYRERAGDPIADRQLVRLRTAATATMLATATSRSAEPATPYRNTLLVLLVLVIIMGIGVVYAMIRDGRRP